MLSESILVVPKLAMIRDAIQRRASFNVIHGGSPDPKRGHYAVRGERK